MKKFCRIEIDPVNGNRTIETCGTLPELLSFATECVRGIYDGLKDEMAKELFKKAFTDAVNEDVPFCNEEALREKTEKKKKETVETIAESIDADLKEVLGKSGFVKFLKKILSEDDAE